MDFEFIFRDSKSKVTKPHTCYGPQVQVQGARVFVHIFVYYYHYYCYYCYYYGYPQPGNLETFEVMDLKEVMVNRVAELATSAKMARTIAIEVYAEFDSLSEGKPKAIIPMNRYLIPPTISLQS